jgi:hypothetical protein
VTVTETDVHVRMGWAFDATIPRARITSAARATKPAMFGWGVHGWNGRWVVNGSDSGIVRLTIDPPILTRMLIFALRPRELFISLDEPDRFLTALEHHTDSTT